MEAAGDESVPMDDADDAGRHFYALPPGAAPICRRRLKI